MRLVPVMLLAAVLPSCTAAKFDKATASFETSVTTISASLDGAYAGLAQDRAARQLAILSASKSRAEMSLSCEDTGTTDPEGKILPPCALIPMGGREPTVGTAEREEAKYRAQVAALRRYATALRKITSAETRAQLEAAIDGISDSALAMGTATGLPQGAAAGLVASTAIKLVGTAYLQINEARRYEILKTAVEACQDPLEKLGTVLGASLDTVRLARISQIAPTIEARMQRLGPSLGDKYDVALAPISEKKAVYDALRREDPQDAVQAVVKAHRDLRDAVVANKGESVQVAEAMQDLAEKVAKLRAAIAALEQRGI